MSVGGASQGFVPQGNPAAFNSQSFNPQRQSFQSFNPQNPGGQGFVPRRITPEELNGMLFTPVTNPNMYYISPEQKEKSQIRNASNIVGATFILMSAITFLLNLATVIVAAIFKGAGSAADILWEPAVLQVQQILFSIIAFTVPFLVVFKIANVRISSLISFSKPQKGRAFPLFLMGISFCAFANIATSFLDSIFQSSDIGYEVPWPDNPVGVPGFILSVLSTIVVPALAEEFACRGVVLGYLKKFGEGFAVIVSAVMFGLMHGNFEQMPFAFLVGLVLGFVTVKSGTILIAMAIHAFNNGISLLFDYLPSSISDAAKNTSYAVFLVVCLLLGIVALFMLGKKDDSVYRFSTPDMLTPSKRRFTLFFTSVPVIVYAVICLIEAFSYFVL